MRLFCRFHFQDVIKSIEVVKQSNCCRQLDDFAFVKVFSQLFPLCVVKIVRVRSHFFRQPQGGLFRGGKVIPLFEVFQMLDLVFTPPVPSRQDGM